MLLQAADLLCQATFLKGTRASLREVSWESHSSTVAKAFNLVWAGKAKCFKVCLGGSSSGSTGVDIHCPVQSETCALTSTLSGV